MAEPSALPTLPAPAITAGGAPYVAQEAPEQVGWQRQWALWWVDSGPLG